MNALSLQSPAAADPVREIAGSGLRRLHMDLLGRPPFEGERSALSTETRCEVVERVVATVEFWENWLEEQLYFFLLVDNHRPAAESVRAIPADLVNGRLSVSEALHRVCLSSSFDRRNPGPDTFVSVVMEQLLGLTVQDVPRELAMGKRLYDGRSARFLGRQGDSQADVVRIAIADERTVPHFLNREYARLIREVPERSDLARWSREASSGERGLARVYREWFCSAAYERRLSSRILQPNRLFVRTLFVDLLARLPGDAETQRIRNALDGLTDSAPLRSLIAKMILESEQMSLPERSKIDGSTWVSGLFDRLLDRPPTEHESRVFSESLRDPDCRMQTVVYAIVSHAEYQTW